MEDQEREERSKDESLRLLRTEVASSQLPAVTGSVVEGEDDTCGSGGGGALGEVEMPQLEADAEREQLQQRSRLSSPSGVASESNFRDRLTSTSTEDGGGNFEDEFDPILASIRKPPQQQPASTATAMALQTSPRGSRATPPGAGGDRKQDSSLPNSEHDAGRPSAGSTFAASFLSMLPGDMRAKAGEVMAQSSARITESANAFRSALDPGGAAPPLPDKFKRRQSGDPTYGEHLDLEEGRGGKSAGRRAAAGEGDEDEVRLLNVNELLSEEEVRRSHPGLEIGVCVCVCVRGVEREGERGVERWREGGREKERGGGGGRKGEREREA